MKITIYSEHGLDLDLHCISDNISRLAPDLNVVTGTTPFNINGLFVLSPISYKELSPALLNESADSDNVILFTKLQYDNNYFWDEFGNKAIISLSGWHHLTSLTHNNGAVFFICARIMEALDIGLRHDDNTGCVKDFLMDKTGVDLGMRSGSVCSECSMEFHNHGNRSHVAILSQIQSILGDLGKASRTDMDICEYWKMRAEGEDFDVFLCHNDQDKDQVRKMNVQLQAENIRTWFDEEQLPPGRLWQELLEEQIVKIKTVAVLVGQSGIGPWQNIELRAFLSEFAGRRCPIIPVILPDPSNIPQLPLFLRQFTWVDFRKTSPDPFAQLLWGIRGRRN